MIAVSCIKRSGSRSPPLSMIMQAIFRMAQARKWYLSAVHLTGSLSVITDSLPRKSHSLNRVDVGQPLISNNSQHPSTTRIGSVYVSPNLDSQATARDAFLQDWDKWRTIYLFPPLSQISKVLSKLLTFKGTAYLTAPKWPNRHWFLLL